MMILKSFDIQKNKSIKTTKIEDELNLSNSKEKLIIYIDGPISLVAVVEVAI